MRLGCTAGLTEFAELALECMKRRCTTFVLLQASPAKLPSQIWVHAALRALVDSCMLLRSTGCKCPSSCCQSLLEQCSEHGQKILARELANARRESLITLLEQRFGIRTRALVYVFAVRQPFSTGRCAQLPLLHLWLSGRFRCRPRARPARQHAASRLANNVAVRAYFSAKNRRDGRDAKSRLRAHATGFTCYA